MAGGPSFPTSSFASTWRGQVEEKVSERMVGSCWGLMSGMWTLMMASHQRHEEEGRALWIVLARHESHEAYSSWRGESSEWKPWEPLC